MSSLLPFALDEDGVSSDTPGIRVAWMRDHDGSVLTKSRWMPREADRPRVRSLPRHADGLLPLLPVGTSCSRGRYGLGVPRASSVLACSAALAFAGCGNDGAADAQRADLVAAAAPAAPPTPTVATKVVARPTDDAEAAESFAAADPSALTEKAPSPKDAQPTAASSGESSDPGQYISPGAPSDEEIERELQQMERVQRSSGTSAGATAGGGSTAKLNADGTASPPKGAPDAVRRIISAGNAIAKFPYVYGGGHGSFTDTAYDCSGSVSYALAAAGLVRRPMVSGEFAKTGEAGPGKWVTIYANEGHMFMVVAGLRYDTSGRGGPLGSRWQTTMRPTKSLEVRHPPGL